MGTTRMRQRNLWKFAILSRNQRDPVSIFKILLAIPKSPKYCLMAELRRPEGPPSGAP